MMFINLKFKQCICRLVIFCYLFFSQQVMPITIVAGIAGFSTASVSRATDVSLHSGFNLFSYPIQLPIQGLSCADLKTDLGAELLKRLDGGDQIFRTCQENDFLIESGEGYVVRMGQDANVPFNGDSGCQPINLFPGLNLIGVPTPAPGSGCYDMLARLGDAKSIASIQRFDKDQGRFFSCEYDLTLANPQPQGTNFPILSSEAYLVSSHVAINDINLNDVSQCQPILENRPPVLDPIGPRVIAPGQTLRIGLTASDPDGDKLLFSSSTLPLPDHAGLNAQTGVFEFTPDGGQVGIFNIRFIASDGTLSTAETVAITVQQPDPNAPTQLSGRVLDTNDFVLNAGLETAVVGATVSLLNTGISTITDINGFFTLNDVPAGQQIVDIDSSTAQPGPNGAIYAGFREKLTLIENIDNNITRPFFLPQIAAESLTTVDPTSTTTVSNTTLGVSLAIPPHTAKNPDGSDFTGKISISLVPNALAPATLPEGINPGLLITLQPVGVTFTTPVPISFPNTDNLPPGSETDLWSLDPGTGGFVIAGTGKVSADGATIETTSGGVRATDWHFIIPVLLTILDTLDNGTNQNSDFCIPCTLGSQTHADSGNLLINHPLAAYQSQGRSRALRLVYNSLHADPQPTLVSESIIPRRSALPNSISTHLTVAGIDQGVDLFTSTQGLDENANESLRQVVQFDASEFATGSYAYEISITNHFNRSTVATVMPGNVLVNNQSQSPLGSGWTLDGLQRLYIQDDDSALITDGNGSSLLFDKFGPGVFNPFDQHGIGFIPIPGVVTADFNSDTLPDIAAISRFSLPGSVSILLADGNGGFSPRIQLGLGGSPKGLAVGDFNGDLINDLVTIVGVTTQFIAVLLGDGAGGFSAPAFFTIPTSGGNFLTGSSAVSVGDFNADTQLDVVVANQIGSDISLFLGDGAGSFAPATNFAAGFQPRDIVTADFNRDGKLDVATANNTSISLLLGDGAGSFSVPTVIGGVSFALALTVGDLNQDGWPDLATTGNAFIGNTVFYLLNNRLGGFLPATAIDLKFGDLSEDVAISDINNDGFSDIITANKRTNNLSILLGDAAGSFTETNPVPVGESPIAIALADFDNSGAIDIVAQTKSFSSNGFIAVLMNSSNNDGFRSPAGEYSRLAANQNGTFTRTLKNGTQIHFDAEGLQTSRVDRNNNTTLYAYDAEQRLISITDPVGLKTNFTYVGGRLSSITDPTGKVSTFQHDNQGNLTQITDPDNSSRKFAYDSRHRLTRQTSKRNLITQYSYNFAGRNIQADRPDGSVRKILPAQTIGLIDTSSGLGNENNQSPVTRPDDAQASFIDGNGQALSFQTNRYGSSTGSVDALGRKTSISRDVDNNPTQIISPNGAVSTMTYDNSGNLLTQVQAMGTPLQKQSTMTYEPDFNQLTQITDPEGNITRIDYDANGNPVKITDPLNKQQQFTYNAQGLLLTRTDQNGQVTRWTYDSNGNIATVTDAEGNKTTLSRDAAGNIVSRTDAFGTAVAVTNSFTYDALYRLLTRTDGTGAVTKFRYDAQGNLLETENATGQIVKRSYDQSNRLIQIENPVSGITQFKYDANGNIIEQTDALNQKTAFSYDAANQLIQSTDALGQTQNFNYDVQGNVVALQNAAGQSTQFTYDILNRLTEQTNPLGLKTTFTYDNRNKLLTRTDAKGQLLTHSYDALSRRTQTVTADDTLQYSYDAVGNLLTATDNDSSLSYTYDALNRIATTQTLDVGFQPALLLSNTYNAISNRIQLDDSAGGTTQFSYDLANRLTRLVTPAGDTIDENYDPAGRLQQITRPNNIISDYSYDVQGRLSSITHALTSFSYGYNALGNITSITEPGKTRTFTYDALQRLITGGTVTTPENYSYDALGNRIASHLSASHNHDMANRLLEDDQFSYDYDDNGNLISKTAKADASVTSYRYDALNRLVGIDFADGTAADYRYDALGRRIEKDVDGTITRYIYDGADILLEYDGSNTLIARYSHGQQTDQPLSIERGGQRYFYQADYLGSIRKIVDVNGNEVNSYDYDAYGRVENRSEGVSNPFTYTGRELDGESGLFFYRARYYDAQTGRFISEDPIGFAGGDENFYRYVGGNPVNALDSFGFQRIKGPPKSSPKDFGFILNVIRLLISAREEDERRNKIIDKQSKKIPKGTSQRGFIVGSCLNDFCDPSGFSLKKKTDTLQIGEAPLNSPIVIDGSAPILNESKIRQQVGNTIPLGSKAQGFLTVDCTSGSCFATEFIEGTSLIGSTDTFKNNFFVPITIYGTKSCGVGGGGMVVLKGYVTKTQGSQ